MKRVIFILLICALLVHLHVWALEDVTVLKEDVTVLIKKLEDANESIRQEARKQLLDIIWQKSVRPLAEKKEFEEGDILLSDIDGNGTIEIIASIKAWLDGYIAVLDETLSTIQVIEVGEGDVTMQVKVVKITNLLGEEEQALIIEDKYGGSAGYNRWIEIHQWGQGKFTKVWSRSIEESWYWFRDAFDRFSVPTGGTCARAKVQIVDLDQDGIREIVRIWEMYKNEWSSCEVEELSGGETVEWVQKLERAKVEIEMGGSLDRILDRLDITTETHPVKFESDVNFDKVTSGYETFRRFKETYSWNKDFNRYIQHTVRITKDTTVMVDKESVSIASGTVVGVLGNDFQEGFNPDSVDVVLPDGRIVSVDKGMTTSNFQK